MAAVVFNLFCSLVHDANFFFFQVTSTLWGASFSLANLGIFNKEKYIISKYIYTTSLTILEAVTAEHYAFLFTLQ